MDKRKFGIIGGGLTGLTTAYRLSKAGHDVTIFEASDTLGGLAAGFDLAGHRVEHAYHFLYKTDEYILAMVDELGLTDKLEYHKSSVSTYYDDKLYPMMSPIDLIRFSPLNLIDRIRAGVTVLWLQRVKDWRSLSEITALDWLRKYAGKNVTDVIWEPLLRGKFDRYYDKVTMSWLWGRVVQRVDSRDAKVGGEALGYFEGGFKCIIDRLVAPIVEHGGDIRLNTMVRKIAHDDATDEVIVTTEKGEERFDRVLATVPSHVVAKLVGDYEEKDPEFFSKLNSIDYLDAALQVFATKQKLTDYYWHNINTPNAPFVVFLSLTELVGTKNYDGLNIYYIGDYVPSEHEYMSMEPADLKKRWYGELKKMFPDFDETQIVDDAVFKMRNAQHIVDIGFEENKLLPHQTPCPGVLMCNFSQIYPMDRGTNYAIRDGNRMAERLLSEVGEKGDAGDLRKFAAASFVLKDNEVSVDGNYEPELAAAARTESDGAKKKSHGWLGAIGNFIQRRPWSTSAVALVAMAGAAAGSIFVGFEIGDRELPTYSVWKKLDKVVEGAFFMDLPDQIQSATYATGLIKISTDVKNVELAIDRPEDDFNLMAFAGGGMASFGDDLLLLPYDGRIYAELPGQDIRRTKIRAPDTNREAFQALPDNPATAKYSIDPYYVRYNDLTTFDNETGRGLLASYTQYHEGKLCSTNNVARLDFDASVKSINDVEAAPGDWTIVYRSSPCLPLKERWSALEGHMGGGRIEMSGPTTVILTMGDFHWDGMRSDGLGIAQDPEKEYGKVMSIDIMTGESKMVSMGHRNPQGLAIGKDGTIYVAEHGPKGGDELNVIREGANYGWPKESLGITYANKRLPEAKEFGRHDTFEAPIFAWMPSPAVSSVIEIQPGFDEAWEGDLLVGSLAQGSLLRLRMEHGKPVYSETITLGTRIRDIHQHTNGQIVLWTDNHELIWLTAEPLSNNEDSIELFIAEKKIPASLAHQFQSTMGRCVECHSFEAGDSQRSPSLARIFGDNIASTDYPAYSTALAGKSGRWNEENLKAFLSNPQEFAPGTRMAGVVVDEPEVAEVIAKYLKDYDSKF